MHLLLYPLYFVLVLGGGLFLCLVGLYAVASAWTTVAWLMLCLYRRLRGKPVPTWWEVFMSLDGGNQ